MTRPPDFRDPEVLADLRRRVELERTRPTSPEKIEAVYAWKAPEFIGAWKCRTCGQLVPIQESDMANLAMWNRELRKRNEEPIDTARIVFCDACRTEHRKSAPGRRTEEVARLAEVIRTLKGAADPDREMATIRTLRDLGHPDVDGLLSELRERAGAKATKKARTGSV